ncbi:hypothetical protein Syun_009874 [Stephania yunnanensis]|uniref:Uncharacterized protein n=1 Tax=Stephania yunnanensis TaxID=152371 RepID=A0AAP0KGF3_9MAGN
MEKKESDKNEKKRSKIKEERESDREKREGRRRWSSAHGGTDGRDGRAATLCSG